MFVAGRILTQEVWLPLFRNKIILSYGAKNRTMFSLFFCLFWKIQVTKTRLLLYSMLENRWSCVSFLLLYSIISCIASEIMNGNNKENEINGTTDCKRARFRMIIKLDFIHAIFRSTYTHNYKMNASHNIQSMENSFRSACVSVQSINKVFFSLIHRSDCDLLEYVLPIVDAKPHTQKNPEHLLINWNSTNVSWN